MSFALDTNLCIAVLRRRNADVRRRLRGVLEGAAPVIVSTIVVHELVVGTLRSADRERNERDVRRLLERLTVIPFEHDDARVSAEIGDDLQRRGMPIGGYDLLIAAQALRRRLTLVTSNTREFGRIRGLKLDDWLI